MFWISQASDFQNEKPVTQGQIQIVPASGLDVTEVI